MYNVAIRIRDNGTLVSEGPISVVDADGKAFPLPADNPVVALCRCGLSGKKPFCDGAHKGVFESQCRVPS